MTTLDDDLVTIAEATRLLKVGRTTLHRWLKGGRLRAYRVGPRGVRIRRGDLQALITLHYGGGETIVTEAQPLRPADMIRPLTDEDVKRGRAALAASQARVARMRAERGNRPLAPSWPLIREAREERERLL